MTTPNFFIIGAPKCGTTSIAHSVAQHPDVFITNPKEPYFFNSDMTYRHIESVDTYTALYGSAGSHRARGEGSTLYLMSRSAVPNILNYAPSARFVVCLRDPVQMVQSWHAQLVFEGQETHDSLEDAWNLQGTRSTGNRIPRGCRDPRLLQYHEVCQLGEQVDRLLSHVEEQSVHFILLDDLASERERTLADLFRFLEVEPGFKPHPLLLNSRKSARSPSIAKALRIAGIVGRRMGVSGSGLLAPIHSLNRRPWRGPEPSEDFLRYLRRVFDPSVALLERLLQRSLPGWRLQ